MFKTYDSSESPFVPTLHSAFDDQTILGANVSPRESIEVRAICFFLMESNSGTYSGRMSETTILAGSNQSQPL